MDQSLALRHNTLTPNISRPSNFLDLIILKEVYKNTNYVTETATF